MIELQRFEKTDFTQLIGWIESPAFLHQWGGAGFTYPLDEKQLEKYLADTEKENAELFAYKVIQQKTGKTIGHISLGRIDRKHRNGRIGRVLVGDPAVRGQGIGKQMMEEVLKVAFDDLKLHRVSLGVFDFNLPAIACYEKVGFIKEGLLRDTGFVNGEYWSIWEMSMLENEWEAKGSGK